MLSSSRSQEGLTDREIERCQLIWENLDGNACCPLDVSQATKSGSHTRFNQDRVVVYLGADVMPGNGISARSRMSEMACLAHELAHAERYHKMKIDRPDTDAANPVDEAEASLHASFMQPLSISDRNDLIEDARDRIIIRLSYTISKEENDEN